MRADAERNVAAILETAVELLSERPDASMSDIATAAGLARQTVYAHYHSREALLSAVAERALAQAVEAIDSAEPGRGDPVEALARLVVAWWRAVARNARVLDTLAAAFSSPEEVHALHAPILERLARLIKRGQRRGAFDRGLAPHWLAVAFLGLMHTAAEEVAAGRLGEAAAEDSLTRSIPRMFGVAEKRIAT